MQYRQREDRVYTFKAVKGCSHETQRLVEVGLVIVVFVAASKFNAAGEEIPNMLGGCHNIGSLIGNVVLHARFRIDAELGALVDWTAKSSVVLAGVDIVGIVLGVINMVLGAVATKTLGSNLEFTGAVAKGEEGKDAEKEADGFCRDRLDSADVDGLRIVTKPVAKVDTSNHELAKLFAVEGAGHDQREQGIFDITVSPYKEE